jgi:hypothetical protein
VEFWFPCGARGNGKMAAVMGRTCPHRRAADHHLRPQLKPPWVSIRQAEPNRGHPVVGLHESYTRDVWNRPVQWQPIPALRNLYEQPVTSPFHRRAAISHPGRTMIDMQGVARQASADPSADHRRPARLSSSPSHGRLNPRALAKEFEWFPRSERICLAR